MHAHPSSHLAAAALEAQLASSASGLVDAEAGAKKKKGSRPKKDKSGSEDPATTDTASPVSDPQPAPALEAEVPPVQASSPEARASKHQQAAAKPKSAATEPVAPVQLELQETGQLRALVPRCKQPAAIHVWQVHHQQEQIQHLHQHVSRLLAEHQCLAARAAEIEAENAHLKSELAGYKSSAAAIPSGDSPADAAAGKRAPPGLPALSRTRQPGTTFYTPPHARKDAA